MPPKSAVPDAPLHHQPGHPHGLHTHIYLGEIPRCVPLHDPRNVLQDLKPLADPHPPLLKMALARSQLWKAGFALRTTRGPVERGDVFHASGSFFRCVACLVQALHALNERYPINEKGTLGPLTTSRCARTGSRKRPPRCSPAPAIVQTGYERAWKTWSISSGRCGRSARACSRTVSPSASPRRSPCRPS